MAKIALFTPLNLIINRDFWLDCHHFFNTKLGDIGGVPRVLDTGQCNDSYSLALIALKLKDVFGLA